MEVIVLGQILFRDQLTGVPIQSNVIDELEVFIAEKEPVLPVLLILIYYLLFDLFGKVELCNLARCRDLLHLNIVVSTLLIVADLSPSARGSLFPFII